MLETYEKNSKNKLVVTFLAIMVIAGSVLLADYLKTKDSTPANTLTQTSASNTPTTNGNDTSLATNTTNTASTTPTVSSNSSSYKDGTYTATSDYYVPDGNESIQVSLTLSNGVITNASIRNSESNNVSANYQESFAAAYKSYVVGKKISGLQLGVIAGASDTAQGFDDALNQIASKAQV